MACFPFQCNERCNDRRNDLFFPTMTVMTGPRGPRGIPGPIGPIGPAGATGPQGPAGVSPVLGMTSAYLVGTAGQTLTAAGTPITLNEVFLENGTAGTNSVTVNVGGLYKVDYGFAPDTAAGETVSLYQNGAQIANTDIEAQSGGSRYASSTLLTLAAGDTLSMRMNEAGNLVIPAGSVASFLTLTPVRTA